MAEQQVNTVYTADTTQYSASVAEAVQATEKYAETVDNTAGRIGKAGITISRAMMNMPIFGGKKLTPAVMEAAKYQEQLSLISSRAKVSGGNISQLGRDVRGLARDFPIGMGKAVEQFESLQRAGKSGKELKGLTVEMTKLGAATGEMGVGLTNSMTQFSRSFGKFNTEGVKNLGDSVTTLSSQFGASATSILDFSNAIAPIAKTVGLSSTEVLGFSTAFAKVGEDGGRASTVFNKMLSDMERGQRTGSGEMRNYAEALGMTTEQFTSFSKSNPAEAVTQFLDAIGKSGPDGIRILENLGFEGVRSMKAIQSVAQSGDLADIQAKAASGYGGGATEEGAAMAEHALRASMDKTGESINQLVEGSAKPLMETMTGVSEVTSDVASSFASVAQSGPIQSFTKYVSWAMMALTAGKMAVGGASLIAGGKAAAGMGSSMFTKFAGSPLGVWAANPGNAQMLRMGGLAGLAVGVGTQNPMMGALGLGALALGPGMSALTRAAASEGGAAMAIKRGAKKAGYYAWRGFDAFYGGMPGSERFSDMAYGKERGGYLYGKQQASMQRVAGLPGFIGPDNGKMYSEALQKEIDTARYTAVRTTMDSGTAMQRTRLIGRTLKAAPMTAARTLASTGGALLGLAGASAPVLIGAAAIGGVAAVATGAYVIRKQMKDAREGTTELEEFATKTGIAAQGLDALETSLKKAEESVTSLSDAMKITTSDTENARNPDYKSTYVWQQDRTNQQTATDIYAKYGNQSPAMLQRIKTDLLSQDSQGNQKDVQEVLDSVSAMSSGTGNFLKAASETNAANKSGWDTVFDTITGGTWSPGGNEAGKTIRAAGAQIQVTRDDYSTQFGPGAAAEFDLKTAMPQAIKEATVNTSVQQQEEILRAAGAQDSEFEGLLDYIRSKKVNDEKVAKAEASGKPLTGFDKIAADLYASTTPEQSIAATDYGKRLTAEINDNQKSNLSALKAITANSDAYGAKDLKDALAIAEGRSKPTTLSALLSEYDDAKAKGEALPMTDAQALAARTYTRPEDTAAQMSTQAQAVQSAMDYYAGKGGSSGAGIGDQVAAAEAYRATGGEVSTEVIRTIGLNIEAQTKALELSRGGTLSEGEYQSNKLAFGKSLQQGTDTTGKKLYSTDKELAALSAKGTEMQQQVEQQRAQNQRSLLMQDMNRIKQQERGKTDMNRQIAHQYEDARKSEARATEDYERSKLYAEQDFGKQRLRAQEDFNKSRADGQADYDKQMARGHADFLLATANAEEDFAKQRVRSQADYQKGVGRGYEDFAKSMKRQAEEIARSMTNPMERMGSERTWGAEGLIQNLDQQNKMIQDQLDTLDTLRAAGLSQDAIDTLHLSDAANAAQTNSMAGMTPEQIAAMNQQVATRMDVGAQMATPENNLQVRQANEDFNLAMERQAADFAEAMARQDEDFATSTARNLEQYNLGVSRAGEDYATSLARAQRDFNESMVRSEVDFNESLVRQEEAFHLSMDRMYVDLADSAKRARDEFSIQMGYAKQDMLDAWNELTGMGDDEREAAVKTLFEGATNSYSTFITNRVKTTVDANADSASKSLGTVATTSTTAGSTVETTASGMEGDVTAAFDAVGLSAEDNFGTVETEGVGSMTTIKTAIETTMTSMATMLGKVNLALTGMLTNATSTVLTSAGLIAAQIGAVVAQLKTALGDYGWLFQQSDITANKTLVLKFDQASFDSTFGIALGDTDTKKAGYQVPDYGSGGAPRGGAVLTGTTAMNSYSGFMDGKIGDSTMTDTRSGKDYPVFHHCLRNAIEAWIQSTGNKDLKIGRLDSAAIHANRVKGQMKDGPAPKGALYWWGATPKNIYGHVSIADGAGNATNNWGGNVIERNPVKSMSPGSYMGWTSPHTSLGRGGLVVGSTRALIGEAGPELVLPLDERGAEVLTRVLDRYQSTHAVREARTSGHVVHHTTSATTITNDNSMTTGPVTVRTNDPDAFASGLRAVERQRRLATRV